MRLKSFRVQNFRSVADSGMIKVDEITAMVGRNESGKSNLLLALASINPPEGRQPLSKIKDFPRNRRLEECTDTTPVVTTVWEVEAHENKELGEQLVGADKVTEVEVGRFYKNQCWVRLDVSCPSLDLKEIKSIMRRFNPHIKVIIEGLTPELKPPLESVGTSFQSAIEQIGNSKHWADTVTKKADELRQAIVRANATLSEEADKILNDFEEKADEITSFEQSHARAREKILSWVPRFIYISEFPELNGHQNIGNYLSRKNSGELIDADKNFEKLAKVASFNPAQLQELLQTDDHETRNQLVNRAGAIITTEIRRLWKDRQLKIRFNLDGNHLDTVVSDPNQIYDVEVNLDERSRGFKWFFSFYVTFAADTVGGHADGAILLLDEPGLYLHATSQSDLLKHLREDFQNQIIYTTHSPFMVPADAIRVVRTVNISQEKGTYVTNNPTGDSRTLFPLQAALGYYLSQTLFVGNSNLIVEGVTDFWIISSMNSHFLAVGRYTIPDSLVITPAGGAPRISYMVALLTSQRLDVMVLLDDEQAGQESKKDLLSSKLIRDNNIIFVSEAFTAGTITEADIEDLIDANIYEALVQESYKTELKNKNLKLNPKIPRIVKRVEEAFKGIGIEFQKTRPARLFMAKMGSEPDKVLTTDTITRFEKLFQIITQRLEQHTKAAREPFR